MGVQISGDTGNVLATKGTYTGNLTVGGVLTYEDVTNVDSVGLVTARSGIEIGARPGVAASISVDGNMIVSGISTIANSMVVESSSNERLRIASAGNVGINTITPRSKLHILSGGSGFGYGTVGQLVVENSSDSTIQLLAPSTHSTNLHFGDENNGMVGRIGYAHTDNSMRFTTGNIEKMRLNSSGLLLVNIDTPRYNDLLQVEGTGGDSAIAVIRNSNNGSGAGLLLGKSRTNSVGGSTIVQDGDKLGVISFGGADGTDLESVGSQILCEVDGTPGANDMPGRIIFKTTSDGSASSSERVRITSAGKLNVGGEYDASTYNLQVTGNGGGDAASMAIKNLGSHPARLHLQSGHGNWSVGNSVSIGDALEFRDETEDITRMIILSDGAVCVNATARPVVGTEFVGVDGGNSNSSVGVAARVGHKNGIPFFASNGSNSTSQRLIRFAAGSGGDTRGTITWNGSNIVYGGSSDYRLKKNVTSLTDGITKLKQLKPITFDWIKETDNNNVMGFLAHEVKEVIPQVVTGEKDEVDSEGKPEYQELDYGGMTPLIVAALQEAVSEIETLKAEVAALKSN